MPAEKANPLLLFPNSARLPLALDQAGAYIEETPSSLSEYLELYQAEGEALRKQRGELPADHPHVAQVMNNYAKLLDHLDRAAEAADLRARADQVRARHARRNTGD